MPFDPFGYQPVAPDMTKFSWEGLAYLLRHKEMWPRNFHWNYRYGLSLDYMGHYEGCAIGLMSLRWQRSTGMFFTVLWALIFHSRIFAKGSPFTTPGEVADRIDAMLLART